MSLLLCHVSYIIIFVSSTVSNLPYHHPCLQYCVKFPTPSSLSRVLCQTSHFIISVSTTVSSLLHHRMIFVSSTVSNLPFHHLRLNYCIKSPTPSSLSLILCQISHIFPVSQISHVIPVSNIVKYSILSLSLILCQISRIIPVSNTVPNIHHYNPYLEYCIKSPLSSPLSLILCQISVPIILVSNTVSDFRHHLPCL